MKSEPIQGVHSGALFSQFFFQFWAIFFSIPISVLQRFSAQNLVVFGLIPACVPRPSVRPAARPQEHAGPRTSPHAGPCAVPRASFCAKPPRPRRIHSHTGQEEPCGTAGAHARTLAPGVPQGPLCPLWLWIRRGAGARATDGGSGRGTSHGTGPGARRDGPWGGPEQASETLEF